MFTQSDGESKNENEQNQDFIRNNISQQDGHASFYVDLYIRFVSKSSLHRPAENQLSAQFDHATSKAQLNDVNLQRMIRIICDEQLPASHPVFESQFF